MRAKRFLTSLITLFSLLLAGCSAIAAPEMIASFPQSTPIAVYPEHTTVVYSAYIELIVSSVDRAAERSAQLVYDYGGYLVSSQSWYVDGRKVSTLVLGVPTSSFERLRRALLGMGDLVSEQVTGELTTARYPEPQYSYITLHLRPSGGISLPPIDPPGWDPGRTFQRAFTVFISIFGFLADILIWVAVVAGPFIVVGLLLWLGIRWMRRKAN